MKQHISSISLLVRDSEIKMVAAFSYLYTDDFWRDFQEISKQGIKFVRPSRKEVYGNMAVFENLYGN